MKIVIIFALCIATVNAFVCLKDTCSRINCSSVTACNGRITKGLCGCCDVCIVTLREGEVCNPYPFLGLPPHSECGFNLVCSKHTMTCIKPLNLFLGGCNEERSKAMLNMLPGAFLPKCDADGSYAPVQCHGSICTCVTKEGKDISGFKGHIHNTNCNCARDQFDYHKSGFVGRMFMCESNGNYKRVQCMGSVCFCADKFGKQIGSSGVPIGDMNSLNC